MTGPSSAKPGKQKTVKVKTVVKEYLDTILADVFPDISDEPQDALQPSQPDQVLPSETLQSSSDPQESYLEKVPLPVTDEPVKPSIAAPTAAPPVEIAITKEKIQSKVNVVEDSQAKVAQKVSDTLTALELAEPEPEVELKYPQAPPWAQIGFDILLFNVCGLKLAVSMESLGRIIKVEHETSQIIGKPDWFIGAYHESEQHLYVVDTAKFIMPEKGFDLAELGFNYIIQLQRSDWTLACKEVYKTIRISPDQVKWRSQKGKRQWLAGTVIEHMCALIHVDSLITLLQEQAS